MLESFNALCDYRPTLSTPNVRGRRLVVVTTALRSPPMHRRTALKANLLTVVERLEFRGGPLEAVTEVYDLKKDYDEKHGTPNASSPKVFIKYFFVNTVTGEKSGEMLVLATLQEDQPDGE